MWRPFNKVPGTVGARQINAPARGAQDARALRRLGGERSNAHLEPLGRSRILHECLSHLSARPWVMSIARDAAPRFVAVMGSVDK
jgi:hypothetical protein